MCIVSLLTTCVQAGISTGVARILCLGGPENRGAVGAEFETPKASSGEGNGEGVRLPSRLWGAS